MIVAVKIKEQEIPILSSGEEHIEFNTLLASTYTVIIRGKSSLSNLLDSHQIDLDEYVPQILLGGKYQFFCYSMYDPQMNQTIFEVLRPTYYVYTSLFFVIVGFSL